MSDSTKDQVIDRIIRFALEDLVSWSAPMPLKNIGTVYPEVFKQFTAALEAFTADLRAYLLMLPVQELQQDFPSTTTATFNILFDGFGRAGHLAQRLARLKKDLPMDYVGGWAIKGREVDQPHWRGMAHFTLSEAAMLSLGRDPRKTSFAAAMKCYGRSDRGDRVLSFLEDRYNAIADGLGLDRNDEDSLVDADSFYVWIDTFSVSVDERFRRMMNDRRKRRINAAPRPSVRPAARLFPEKPLHGASVRAHAKIVLAMAMKNYGLKGAEGIGKAAKAIQSDGHLLGLNCDQKVIRALLNDGLEALAEPNDDAL